MNAIADGFVGAALEPSRWPVALGALASATGSDHGQLIGFGPDFGIGFNWVSGNSADMIEAFARLPPDQSFRVVASRDFADLAVVDERHYDIARTRVATNDYIDLCHEWGITFGCQTNLRDKPNGLIGLALLRSERTGRTTPANRALFDKARVDAAAAVALQIALEEDGYRLIAGAFEAMASACFVMDRVLRVRAMTVPAENLLRDRIVRLDDGRLSRIGAGGKELTAALQGLRSDTAKAQRVILPGEPPSPHVSIQLHRLPQREWDMGFAPFAIAVATRPLIASDGEGASLRSAFGLTGTETDIALMLAKGLSRDGIMAARGISRETLRSHLRALYPKLGVQREREAVWLLGELLR
jgi:DNA-binding CsgD family transcriptional regulator